MAEGKRTPVPDLDAASVAFGNIKHMPRYADLPEVFKDYDKHPACRFVSTWFFRGVSKSDFPPTREGVDKDKAIRALKAIIGSFEPKHEHKIAGAGFLANEWFDFDAKAQSKSAPEKIKSKVLKP